MHRLRKMIAAVLVPALISLAGLPLDLGAQSAPSAPTPPDALAFPETGHWLNGGFLGYWEAFGELQQFGYPISPPLRDADGKTIQWLERARFEYHAGLPPGKRVLLGLLGKEVTAGRAAETPFKRMADPGDGTWFEATGHTLRGDFRLQWERTGGLSVYGYPISEEFSEVNPDDKQTYTVQYFERNRFEWHPELPAAYRVTFGLLGRQLYAGGGEVAPPVPDDAPPPPPPPPMPARTTAPATTGGGTAIGDSVMLGARAALQQTIPNLYVDATVSRQLSQGAAVAQSRSATGTLGSVVVVHLGNNGGITAAQFDQLMGSLRSARRVVVLTLKVPRAWESGNNAIIRAGVGRYPNAVLADWRAISAGHADFFSNDGIHLAPAGARAYAALVSASLR